MPHNIPNKYLPRKERLVEWVVPAIIVLVGVGAFGLGRLSALEGPAALRIHGPAVDGTEQEVLPAARLHGSFTH